MIKQNSDRYRDGFCQDSKFQLSSFKTGGEETFFVFDHIFHNCCLTNIHGVNESNFLFPFVSFEISLGKKSLEQDS